MDISHHTRGSVSVWGRAGKAFATTRDLGDDLGHVGAEEDARRSSKTTATGRRSSKGSTGRGSSVGPLMRANTDLNFCALASDDGGEADGKPAGAAALAQRARAPLSPQSVPAMFAHPIRVTTRFVFLGGRRGPRLAGVVGLPWLQAAVPADVLPQLEADLEQVELRVCPAQMCGPRTCGRLGALFDWCYQCPEFWPADMGAKVLLGLYLAALRVIGSSRWWVLLHLGVAACSVGCGLLVLRCRPCASASDNAALLISLSIVALGASQYELSHSYFARPSADLLPGVLAVLVVCLLALLATTSACVILAALLASSKTVPTVVSGVVEGWRPAVAEDEDAAGNVAVQNDDAEREERRSVEAMVTLKAGSHVLLPARVSAPLQVREVTLGTTSAKKMLAVAGRGCLRVPVAASSLFSQKAYGMPIAQPFGVLDMPDGAVALYEASSLNSERSPWEQVLLRELRGNEDGLRKAEAFLLEGLQRLRDSPGYLEGSYDDEMLAIRAVRA
ncbi:unnamed protein product [Prorocentrum cordatum]|uniref:Uncharacterized protein n=1 Tax=Prorocentrum cordatum TaxID=2364126 RepID=A0ABN9SDP5_9DINO|nr:unnamed protein product [Polarella glacialis]